MANKPIRHNTHILEAKSERFLRNCLPIDWIADKPTDYGIDLKVEITDNNQVTGHNFSIQLKAKDKENNALFTTVILKKSTINFYLARLEPVLVICYIDQESEAYYTWISSSQFDLSQDKQTYSLKIDKANKISSIDWNSIKGHVSKIFSKKFLIEEIINFNSDDINSINEKRAWQLFFSLDYEKAIQEFTKVKEYENNPSILNSIAMCNYDLLRYKEALLYINKALDIAESEQLLVNKASILAEYGITSKDRGKLLEAKRLFKAYVKSKGSADAHYNYANTLSNLEQKEKAEKHYQTCLKIDPNYAQAWKNLGQIYCDSGDNKKGVNCFDKALTINPSLPEALMSKGIVYASIYGRHKDALALIQKSIDADSKIFYKFEQIYYWIAYCYFKLGNTSKTLEIIKSELSNNPGNINLLRLRIDYYAEHWRTSENLKKEAKAIFKKSLNLFSHDVKSIYNLTCIYISESKNAKALKYIKEFHPFFKCISLEFLNSSNISLEDYAESVLYFNEYNAFREAIPAEKYLGELILNQVVPTEKFISHIRLALAYIFCKTFEYIVKSTSKINQIDNAIKINKTLSLSVLIQFSAELMTAQIDETDKIIEQMTSISLIMSKISLMECGSTFGYLSTRLELDKNKLDRAIADSTESTWFADAVIKSVEAINNQYKLFKE